MNIYEYFKEDSAAFYTNKYGKICKHSVHGNSYTRIDKAKKQATMPTVDKEIIINYVKEFLNEIGSPLPPDFDVKRSPDINYSEIKEQLGLKDRRDIIWMKFTADGYLGVVATSDDINFDIPSSCKDYDKKVKIYDKFEDNYKYKWVHNSSGILVHKLKKCWDVSMVLVFPLINIPEGKNRGDVECAVGNFLISKGVPILDFYSHNY